MSEDFLARWSRLKRESAAEPAHSSKAQAGDAASPTRDAASAPDIDLSNLPAIESLSAESTVGAFLQAGVPDDLTRAALRKAWTSDPAIRDFIGIAESQWDFNAEGAIAGFGSLSAEEYARHLAALALRAAGSTPATASSGVADEPDSADGAPVTSAAALPPPLPPIARPPVSESRVQSPAPARESQRTHGSALPK